MKKALALALAAGVCGSLTGIAAGQTTYNSTTTPVALPDNPTIDNSITVADSYTLSDVNVRINITHTFDSDLDMILVVPGATQYVHLATDVGSSGDNFVNTVFDQQAATAITAGTAPFTGSFRPEGGTASGFIVATALTGLTNLANLDSLNGTNSAGTWTLRIDDDATGDIGTLNSWSLILTAAGAPTNPSGVASLTPNSGTSGTVVVARVTVTPGTFPPSTGIQVVANAVAIDGDIINLLDNGVAPDTTAGDNIFSANITVGPAAPVGGRTVSFNITDGQTRASSTSATFTVNPPASPNDLCSSPEVIPVGSLPYTSGPSFIFSNVRAPETGMSCSSGGATNVNSTVWYSITPTQSGNYRFATSIALATGNNVSDTVLAVYSSADGTCGSLTEIGCDDDGGDGLQSDKTVALIAGSTYYIQAAKWGTTAPVATDRLGIWVDLPNTAPTGTLALTPATGYEGQSFNAFVTVTPGGNPASTGLAVSLDASAVNGGTLNLLDDGNAPDAVAGDNIFSGSVTVGAGATLGARTISFGVADAQLRTGAGTGTYTVIAIPTGACCTGSNCSILTAARCATAGGSYLGDNSACTSGDGYVFSDSANALEDISATGLAGPATDDSSILAPLGFSFTYFGNTYTDVNICSNGFINFGAASTALGNTAIPNAATPNDAIYPMWDDFNPTTYGDVYYETRGTAGVDLRFIAQWNAITQFDFTDSNTFQVILFENGTIEFRYGAISAFTDADATVGVENSTGTAASSVAASTIVSNSAKLLTFARGGPVCGPNCAWRIDGCYADFDNNGSIDGDDVIAFFGEWDSGLPCGDVDLSTGVDGDDVILFFGAWDANGIGTPGC
ncbi:MAG: choice-of-anchor X domain-containing protein [Phycisphaerales bacterium]